MPARRSSFIKKLANKFGVKKNPKDNIYGNPSDFNSNYEVPMNIGSLPNATYTTIPSLENEQSNNISWFLGVLLIILSIVLAGIVIHRVKKSKDQNSHQNDENDQDD